MYLFDTYHTVSSSVGTKKAKTRLSKFLVILFDVYLLFQVEAAVCVVQCRWPTQKRAQV